MSTPANMLSETWDLVLVFLHFRRIFVLQLTLENILGQKLVCPDLSVEQKLSIKVKKQHFCPLAM